jgi:hydroxymethylpyrimidine pyrophosphatase-like HAD family hydrolase
MGKNEEFDAEKIFKDLSLSTPVVNSMWYYIRDRSFKQAEKLLEEEKVTKEDAKKLIKHLRDKYCVPVELIEIKKMMLIHQKL